MAHSDIKKMAVIRDLEKKQELKERNLAIDNEIMRIQHLARKEIIRLKDIRGQACEEIRGLSLRKISVKHNVCRGFVEKVNKRWRRGKM